MKLAYVSGPYRAKPWPANHYGTLVNIQKAGETAAYLWGMGFAVICPHKNTAFFDGICAGERFLEGDIVMLERCDLLVMVPGWQQSIGACAEREAAEASDIPVYEWPKDYEKLALLTV